MAYLNLPDALLTQEAFKLTDKIAFEFSTEPLPVKTAKEAVQFTLANGLHAELTELARFCGSNQLLFAHYKG